MKKQIKKLVLAKETLRNLEESGSLKNVAGGTIRDTGCCNTIPCTDGCPTGPIACQSGQYPC
jgi:hypothetical protein